jgi:hypothetical protein
LNVFILSTDPVEAAKHQCNKHVVKMVTETAQLLSTCFPRGTLRFKFTHVNHPCARWARASLMNFKWLLMHGIALSDEYTARYGRVHGSSDVIDACLDLVPDLPNVGLTPFGRAIKEPWKTQTLKLSVVEAYRQYYIGDKSRFARWAPRATAPSWWLEVNA